MATRRKRKDEPVSNQGDEPRPAFSAAKVFSTTMYREREVLGERVTEWLRSHRELRPVQAVVTQSSDREYHCLTITLFLAGSSDAFLPQTTLPQKPAGTQQGLTTAQRSS